MYESFFGLQERAFDLTPNPRFLVLTATHREALSNLEYAIAARKGVSLLIGEAGSGKTTLLRTAIERRAERVHAIHVTNPALTRNEFVEMLSAGFGLSPAARASKATLILELESLLLERRRLGETTLLVIDEAQSLPLELLEEIRLLANIETNEEKLLTVIIAGQPELTERLNDDSLRQFKQRIALRCELRLFSLPESAAYMAGRIRAAGGVAAQLFTRDAVTLIHERSKGIPRLINVLADNSMLTAFALGVRQVTKRIVLDVCRDFDFQSQQPVDRAVDSASAAPVAHPEPVTPTSHVDAGESVQLDAAPAPQGDASAPAPSDAPETGSAHRPLFARFAGDKRRRFFFFSQDERP
jgi:type II secretory pathway predicted ATPase ExeA